MAEHNYWAALKCYTGLCAEWDETNGLLTAQLALDTSTLSSTGICVRRCIQHLLQEKQEALHAEIERASTDVEYWEGMWADEVRDRYSAMEDRTHAGQDKKKARRAR